MLRIASRTLSDISIRMMNSVDIVDNYNSSVPVYTPQYTVFPARPPRYTVLNKEPEKSQLGTGHAEFD